jgi:hypothetical protein
MTEDMAMFLMVAVLGASAIAAVAAAHWRRQRLLELALRERERTLLRVTERFGDLAEFQDFARSPEAQALFATMDAPAAIARRLLAMIAVAIVLLALGAGMWVNSLGVPSNSDINLLNDVRFARWWGTLALATGTGLLIASAVCARLGRRWGVLGS